MCWKCPFGYEAFIELDDPKLPFKSHADGFSKVHCLKKYVPPLRQSWQLGDADALLFDLLLGI
jgi:hypothetical protein